jgi:hypothetical protein
MFYEVLGGYMEFIEKIIEKLKKILDFIYNKLHFFHWWKFIFILIIWQPVFCKLKFPVFAKFF